MGEFNWENNETRPVATQFRPGFLGYDPTPEPQTLPERVVAKQRRLGISLARSARHLGWDPGSLKHRHDGARRRGPDRREAFEAFLDATAASAQVSDPLPNSQRVIDDNPGLPKTKVMPVECVAWGWFNGNPAYVRGQIFIPRRQFLVHSPPSRRPACAPNA